eukprot:1158973-Pelagomonas_calceolata.AAC.16
MPRVRSCLTGEGMAHGIQLWCPSPLTALLFYCVQHPPNQHSALSPAPSLPLGGYHHQQVLGCSSPPPPPPQLSLLPWQQHQWQQWPLAAPMMQHQHLHQLQQHRGIKSKVEVDYQVRAGRVGLMGWLIGRLIVPIGQHW